ncbi:MAG: cysteine desulfurase [Novosphingobium sp.]|nr:cysteine desulfurase [Novosphingobium sp.]
MINLRKDFPYLDINSDSNSLIYLDNAATTQKPFCVIKAISDYYSSQNASVNRGIYKLAENSTELYQRSREIIANFLCAKFDEIIFTSGTTQGVNFVAQSWAKHNLRPGDEIIISQFEHHSNILPWIRLSQELGIVIRYIPINKNNFDLDYKSYLKLLCSKTKLVSITSCSNAIGTNVDLEFIIKHAKDYNAKVLIDAAQSVGHMKFDLNNLNVDFLVFSAHKILGPTGIGILYISEKIHHEVRAYELGGGAVLDVDNFNFTLLKSPECYEPGTAKVAQAIGFSQAINYLNNINFDDLIVHESTLCTYFIEEIQKLKGIKIIGFKEQLKNEGHIVSFVSDLFHPHDIAAYLDKFNIAVRAGTHCAQPLFKNINIAGTLRVSFYLYNTFQEIEFVISKLKDLIKL